MEELLLPPPAAQGLGAGWLVSVLGTSLGVALLPRRSWNGLGPPMAFKTGSCTSRYILCRMFIPPGMASRFCICLSMVLVISCSLLGFLAISIICLNTSGLFNICLISGFLTNQMSALVVSTNQSSVLVFSTN